MPAYEATPDEVAKYGSSLTIWEQIRLLNAWAPLLAYGQRFLAEADGYKKSLIVAEALEWLAAKTDAKLDDELVGVVSAVLRTPQGEALVRWVMAKVGPQK